MIKGVMFLGICTSFLLAGLANAQTITSAKYAEKTTRYDHGVLGDSIEYGRLILEVKNRGRVTITLPKSRVFEDIAPRLVDVDLDGNNEVMVVETSLTKGARLSIYDENGLVAATPFIGRKYRWLAPIGAADLDGDGRVEIAYIDRPHLAKLLKIWKFRDGKLVFVTEKGGLANHRIGEDFISGGVRDCGNGPEIITADSGWSTIVSSVFDGKNIQSTRAGQSTDPQAFARALRCKP